MLTLDDKELLALPRVAMPAPSGEERPVVQTVTATATLEGEGFPVRRPFPGPRLSLRDTDPFLLLDHMGAVEYAPGEAKGAPWHPHRGFETVTYMLEGAMSHHDSNGGGGVITPGDTQWMTAGGGILHDELPTEAIRLKGGLVHGVQLWVNLPRTLKMTPPRYQSIDGSQVKLLASHDGGALIRLIAGSLAGFDGPGVTWTPITYAHVTIYPDAEVVLPWNPNYNALAYVLSGEGTVGHPPVALREGQLARFGPGDSLRLAAGPRQASITPRLEVLLMGGAPIREPIFNYGPFVMNTHEEIVQAIEDFRAGRMGTIPAISLEDGGSPPS